MDLVKDDVAGEPQTGKCWVRQSLSKIQQALCEQKGVNLSRETIRRLLGKQDIRPRSNVKRLHPKPHPDRDKQFQYISSQRTAFQKAGWPCISVDTKKKELLGLFYNRGTQWCQEAQSVNTHDFPSYAQGRANPYGIYDELHNLGYVGVGLSADTPEFAVDVIAWWWPQFGRFLYPDAPELLILADAGGSNGYRTRLWKKQLQERLADRLGIEVMVCHYPTGASKWNPIERRLFSFISLNWAGKPLRSLETMLGYIRNTTTETGLKVKAFLLDREYETAIKVSDKEMRALNIVRRRVCPSWNYQIKPRCASL